MKTNQEIYDAAKHGILSQGGFGFDSISRYRAKNGHKCAAGWLIPDDDYRLEFEQKTVFELGHKLFGINNVQLDLLDDLQRAHDNNAPLCNVFGWMAQMTMVAKAHGLKP